MKIILAAFCGVLFLSLIEAQLLPNARRPPRRRPGPGGPTGPRPPPQPPTSGNDRDTLLRESAQKKNARRQNQQAQNEIAIAQQAGQRNPSIFRATTSPRANGLQNPSVSHNGAAYPIIDGRVTINNMVYLICGNMSGLASEYICCGDILFSLLSGPIECCGDVFLLPDEICCIDNIFPAFFRGLEIGCCSDQALFVLTEICCGGQITLGSTCGGGGGQCPTGFVCCNGVQVSTSTNLQCCNNEFYSTTFQQCCNGLTVKFLQDSCSTTGCVETTTQFCCQNGNVFSKGFLLDCCNEQIFSTMFQKCCNSVEVKLTSESCTSGCTAVPGSTFCCGELEVPLNSGIGCCNGQTFGQSGGIECCGNTLISTTQSCCIGGLVFPIAQCAG